MTPSRNGTHADVLDVTEAVTLIKAGDVTAPPSSSPSGVTGDAPPVSLDKNEGAPGAVTGDTARTRRGPGGLPPLAGTPLVPEWMRDLRSSSSWAVRYVAHVAGFHGVRLPIYLVRACGYTPRGIARALGSLARWALDAESRPLRQAAADAKLFGEFDRLDRARSDKVKARGPAAVAAAAGVTALVAAGLMAEAATVKAVTVLAVILVAGWHGRAADRPLIESAVVTTPAARRITADTITNAFVAARLAKLPDHSITFWAKVHRDGAGWSCVIDLPIGYGKTADDAIAARKRIAAALVVDEGRLFLTRQRGDGGSAGRVNFRLADSDPMTGQPVPSPLLKAPEVDLWKPIPFGIDERGRTVELSLLWTAMTVAGVPRQGKSFSGRVLACAAALDPWARLIVFDAKASPDWRMFTDVAWRYGFGDDNETARHLLATLTELVAEMDRRAHAISQLPRHLAREGKLTRELARSKRANMPLVVAFIDEAQDYLGHPDYGSAIEAAATKLVKRGPFVGIITVWLTQKPSADAIPTGIRDNVTSRFGLRVTTTASNEMALGAGAREQGFDSTMLLPHHLGVGYLVGNAVPKAYAAGGVLVWSHLIDAVGADEICQRGRALREQRGLLTGQAAGERPDDSTVSMLDDIASAFEPGEDWLWSETIIERIDAAHPGRYTWDAKAFGVAVKSLGLSTVQLSRTVDGRKLNRWGLRRDQIDGALERQAVARRAHGSDPGDGSDSDR